jgi:hypothetical protein
MDARIMTTILVALAALVVGFVAGEVHAVLSGAAGR